MFRYTHIQTCFNINISIVEYQVVGFTKHFSAVSLVLAETVV